MNTSVIAVAPGINGNVGSCQINSTDISISSFRTQTIALNSCDGSVVASHQYTDVIGITVMVLVISIIVAIIGMIIGSIFY